MPIGFNKFVNNIKNNTFIDLIATINGSMRKIAIITNTLILISILIYGQETPDVAKNDLFLEKTIKSDITFVSELDSLSLVAIYNSTNGDNWTNNTNWLTEPVYSWYGIEVIENDITQITLYDNNLKGTIPTEIGNFDSLEELIFGNDSLSGSIPNEIGYMSQLTNLTIVGCKVSGAIPKEIEGLTNLVVLNLENNELTDSIPMQIGNLINLRALVLAKNQLSENIPKEIGNLTKLYKLDLSFNQLAGSIPSTIGYLTELGHLYLHSNNLSGPIPTELGNLVNMNQLYLNENNLSGSIPNEIGNLSIVNDLILSDNQLSGEIPSGIGHLEKVFNLFLSNNQLTGSIPEEIKNLTNLSGLTLSNNNLSGTITDSIGNLENLTYLKLNQNNFTGAIPSHFNKLINLKYFDISENNFSNLPNLASLTRLSTFITHHNKFTFEDFKNTGLSFINSSSIYTPQDTLKIDTSVIYVNECDQVVLNCQNLISESITNPDNKFSIYHNGDLVYGWSSNPEYIISSFPANGKGIYSIKVRNNDYTYLTLHTNNFLIDILNYKPTDIELSNDIINEDLTAGSAVGVFTTTDINIEDSHKYSFLSGDGSNDIDNSSFAIDEDTLRTALNLDFETKSTYNIYLQTQDSDGLTFAKAFVINISDVIETDIKDIDNVQWCIYPNPCSGKFHVKVNANGFIIEVYDIIGNKIYSQVVDNSKRDIDLSNYSKGQYIINISAENKVYSKKLIIQ